MNNPLVFPGGVLAQNPNGQPPLSMGTPVLTNPAQPQPKPKPALSQQGQTGNARGSSRVPSMMPIPNPQINMGGEGLMRIGGAIVGGAGRSFTDAFQAGTDMYGQLQDQNRAGELENYKLNEARRLAEQARQDALRKAAGSGKGKSKTQVKSDITRLKTALSALREGGLTGIWDASVAKRFLDSQGIEYFGGDTSKEAKRLLLQELAVFATLDFTEKTKGAVSDLEMGLFQQPIPRLDQDEDIWIAWIEPRLAILEQVERNGVSDEKAKQDAAAKGDTKPTPSSDGDGYTIEPVN